MYLVTWNLHSYCINFTIFIFSYFQVISVLIYFWLSLLLLLKWIYVIFSRCSSLYASPHFDLYIWILCAFIISPFILPSTSNFKLHFQFLFSRNTNGNTQKNTRKKFNKFYDRKNCIGIWHTENFCEICFCKRALQCASHHGHEQEKNDENIYKMMNNRIKYILRQNGIIFDELGVCGTLYS